MILKDNKNKYLKVKPKTAITAAVVLVIVVLLAFGIFFYFSPLHSLTAQNSLMGKMAKKNPLPAAIIGKDSVSISKLIVQLESVRKFYESQDFSQLGLRVDFSTADGQKRLSIKEKDVLNKLIYDTIIKKEAQKRNIVVTKAVVDQQVDRKMKEYGTGDTLKKNLEKLYGWSLEDFKENIVEPDLYREELFSRVRKDSQEIVAAQKKIQEAKAVLSDGEDFIQAAKKYSEGETAQSGGELGWFQSEQMLPEVFLGIFGLEKGETSEIIESSIGYHIVRLEDKKVENDENLFKISQIFVRTQTFSEWLYETAQNYRIFVPLHELKWNAKEGSLEFRDESMNDYDREMENGNIDDPSMLF